MDKDNPLWGLKALKEKMIEEAGGIDLQVLGVGRDALPASMKSTCPVDHRF